jgi:peptide/nickel transport system ATP-binding protein
MAPLLEVRNLSVEFRSLAGTVHANRGVSYSVLKGETLAVLGESGSGKSVSASAVMGILDSPPGFVTGGEALLDGRDLFRMTPAERRAVNGGKIGMVFQDSLAHLNPVYPVGWQIAEALRAHKNVDAANARKEAVRLLERVGIPDPAGRVQDYPHQFSGGQRQRVMIAMALANAPSLLIADEPTSALDVTVQAQILDLLRGLLRESDMGLLMITHDLGVVADIADRVVVMHDGRVVESGPVRDVLRAPKAAYTRRLLDAIPGLHGAAAPRAPATDPPLLEVRSIAKHYPGEHGFFRRSTGQVLRAVDDVSLELRRGETLGIVGESGSGKSTLGRMILALDEPTSGGVRFAGRELAGLKGRELLDFRRRVQAVFQDPFASLNPRMTVFELIAEPWTIHRAVVPRARWRDEVGRLLSRVGMKPEHALRWPHQFSGGQRQRIAIARALALKPDIVVCDEAVSALDVSVQAQVIALLAELRDELGLSYIFIAHDLPVVRDIADRVAVMQRGKVVEMGRCDDIFDRPQHPYTKALLAASPVADPDEQARRRAAAKAA